MGRASSSKKVARAASTGGGRTARGARPFLWYAAIAAVVLLGVSGIVFSRAERREELAAGDLSAPIPGKDHWHSAYGFYLCDSFGPNLSEIRGGIHTHADGLIHAEPLTRSEGGANATLGRFLDQAGVTLTDTELEIPGGDAYTEGKTKCAGKAGEVQVKVDGEVQTTGFDKIRLVDGQVITMAFVSEGTEIPDPPSVPALAEQGSPAPPPSGEPPDPGAPVDGGSPESTTPAVEGEGAPTTVAPADGDTSSTTTAP